ncbi:MAG: ABC transporter permease, partial [Anaerolinea sp.]|nr:ABC transporter permease [Anaerolinea sp.]
IGSISVLITLAFGLVFFRLPFSLDLPLLFASAVLGTASLAAIGVILGAITLRLARLYEDIGSVVAGGLFIFSGAIFPLDVLPAWLQPVGFAFPVAYWLEVTRRALLGVNAPRFPTFTGFSDWGLIGVLAVMTVILWVVSSVFYRWALYKAKDLGLLDYESNF